MPHVLLEYTDNLAKRPNPAVFFADLHRALAATKACAIGDIKSRAVCRADALVGDGSPGTADAFVALQVRVLAGRDVSVRQQLLAAAARCVEAHFGAEAAGGRCQMSVEIAEMERATYTKQWPSAAAKETAP